MTIALAAIAVLAAALVPIWWLALDTPFRLIDDYIDWRTAAALRPLEYLRDVAIGIPGARYRPLNDLGHFAAWLTFGARPRLHHALRLALKAATFALFWGTVAAAVRSVTGRRAPPAALAFAFSAFFFFPNNPEARLAPQELATAFAYCAFAWCLTLPTLSSRLGYAGALASFAAFCLAKEPNALAAGGLLLWVVLEIARSGGRRRTLAAAPFVLLFAHTAVKVALALRLAAYGTAPLSATLLLGNLKFAGRVVLLPFASPWLTVVLAAPLAALARPVAEQARAVGSRWRAQPGPCGLLSLAASAVLLLIAFLTSWVPTLRYAYPATVAWVALDCIGVAVIADRIATRWSDVGAALATAAVALAFAGANLHNVASQFASQSVAGRSEQRLLERTSELLARGDTVAVRQETEFEWSIATYFDEFLPSLGVRKLRVATDPDAIAGATYLVSRSASVPGWERVEEVAPSAPPRLLSFTRPVSALLQLRWPEPNVFLDTGAQNVSYFPWFIHQKPGASASPATSGRRSGGG